MQVLIQIIISVVYLAIFVLQLLMVARAIVSWIPFDDETPLIRFLYCTTEPLILPIRNVLDRSRFLSGFPIDLSFLIAYLLLSVVLYLLPAVNF